MATLDPLQGELAEGVLPGVLRTLYVGRRTGLLHVTRGEERGSVCFVDGNIVYGDTNIKECHMGETLVRHGLLTQWDFERAGEMVSVTGRRLDDTLGRARESLDGGRYWDTLALVEQVLSSAVGRARRRARVLKAEASLKGEGGRRAAEEALKAALEEDRGNAEAHFLLAKIYKAGGAHALAAASLRRVLALQPRHSEAVAELASLGGAPEEEEKKPGGFRKLFGGF